MMFFHLDTLYKWSTTHRVLKSHRSKTGVIYIYGIMKTMCPPGYHHQGFVATHALGHMMHGWTVHNVPKCMSCHKAIVVITGRAHCFPDCIYASLGLIRKDGGLSTLCHSCGFALQKRVLKTFPGPVISTPRMG